MLRNNIKSSLNRSNAFGRKVYPIPQTRIVDLSAVSPVASCHDPVPEQNSVEDVNVALGRTNEEPNSVRVDRKESILSPADPNNTVAVQNSDTAELSGNETQVAKRKKQKESKSIHGNNTQKLSGDIWTLERAMKNCGVEQKLAKDSTEVMTDKKKTKKRQNTKGVETGLEKKDFVENDSGFGDWNRSETLGLASVKTGLITPSSELSEGSENGKNLSECSEVILPSELDTDDILRSLVTDKTAEDGFENGRIGSLAKTLDQRSSVTDSSGVETSSDADSEHLIYATDSTDQKSDILSSQHHDFHQPEDSACEQEAEFTTVPKKRKPKSLQVDKSAKNPPSFSSTDFVSPDSGESSPQQERNTSIYQLPKSACADDAIAGKQSSKLPENSLSQRGTAGATLSSKLCLARQQSDISFDVRHEPSVNFSAPPENSSAEKHSTGHDSVYLDNFSSGASLSDIHLDDFPLSFLLNEMLEDDWTVVKNGRRLKNNVQSTVDQSVAGENKRSSLTNVGQCPTPVTREHVASGYGRGKTSTNSGRSGRSIQNSRCNHFDGSNSKTLDHCWYDNVTKSRPQDASRKNFFPSGVSRSNSNTEPKYRDANGGSLPRCNSSREFSSVESYPFPARCQQIPRFSQKSFTPESDVSMKNSNISVANSDKGAKTAWVSMLDEPASRKARNTKGLSTEKSCLSTEINNSTESSNLSLPTAVKTSVRHGTFNLIETQIYLYREYQEVLEERRKHQHLVVIYDPDSDS